MATVLVQCIQFGAGLRHADAGLEACSGAHEPRVRVLYHTWRKLRDEDEDVGIVADLNAVKLRLHHAEARLWDAAYGNVCAFRRGTDARSIPRIRIPGEHKRDRSILVGKLAEILRDQRPSRKVAAMFIDMAFGSPIYERLRALGSWRS